MTNLMKHGITSYHLKWIAIISMVWDHCFKLYTTELYDVIERIFHTGDDVTYLMINVLFGPGRIAFPLFAFMIAQGCIHTHHIQKYLKRLAILALLSEIPYQLLICCLNRTPITFHWGLSNIFVTLLLGALSCYLYTELKTKQIHLGIRLAVVGFLLWLGWVFQCDYGPTGSLLIFLFYCCKSKKQMLLCAFFGLFMVYPVWDVFLMVMENQIDIFVFYASLICFACSLFCIPIINAYNDTLGRSLKYVFYAFYPVHILVLVAFFFITML